MTYELIPWAYWQRIKPGRKQHLMMAAWSTTFMRTPFHYASLCGYAHRDDKDHIPVQPKGGDKCSKCLRLVEKVRFP